MFCYTKQGHRQNIIVTEKKKKKIKTSDKTSFPMDTEIEWEHALAVTHYYWLTGVIEFRLEKDSLYLWRVPSGEKASYQLVALFLYVYIYLNVCP